mgnify:CR=1 FL=1
MSVQITDALGDWRKFKLLLWGNCKWFARDTPFNSVNRGSDFKQEAQMVVKVVCAYNLSLAYSLWGTE